MGVRRVEELHAWQLAHAFKREVYAVVRASADASGDFRFRGQLFEAASSGESNVEEGFHRYGAGEMLLFLSYARASIAEARGRLKDGVDRGYYGTADAERALALGARAAGAIAALQRSLRPFYHQRKSLKARTRSTGHAPRKPPG